MVAGRLVGVLVLLRRSIGYTTMSVGSMRSKLKAWRMMTGRSENGFCVHMTMTFRGFIPVGQYPLHSVRFVVRSCKALCYGGVVGLKKHRPGGVGVVAMMGAVADMVAGVRYEKEIVVFNHKERF
jgi:hypothetical protein